MANPFSIERYLNIRAANAPSFSPDGRFLTFLSNITGVAQLWQLPTEGGWPTQLSFTNESVRTAHYSPIRHELIFAMDAGGNERTQLYQLTGAGTGTDHGLGEGWVTRDLTHRPDAIHEFGGWSHDGQRLAFSANRDELSRFDVFVQKVGDGDATLLQRGPGGYYLAAGWSPDDKSLLVYHMETNFQQNLYVLDVNDRKARYLTPHRGDAQYHSPHWSADGKMVYCASTAEGRDLAALAQIEVASGKLTYLETPEHEVEGVYTSPKGRWLAWLLNEHGKSVLVIRELPSGKTFSPPDLPLGVISGVEFSQDDNQLAFVFDGPRYNLDVWMWDLASLRSQSKAPLRQLTHSSRAGIPFSQLSEPELIHYPTFDGRKIPAWFYGPAGKKGKPPPVIVYPHGGPESQTRPNFSGLFQYFVERGYAILAPNVRGSSGHGTAYMNLDNTTKRMDSVADLAHAAYWLRDRRCHLQEACAQGQTEPILGKQVRSPIQRSRTAGLRIHGQCPRS